MICMVILVSHLIAPILILMILSAIPLTYLKIRWKRKLYLKSNLYGKRNGLGITIVVVVVVIQVDILKTWEKNMTAIRLYVFRRNLSQKFTLDLGQQIQSQISYFIVCTNFKGL